MPNINSCSQNQAQIGSLVRRTTFNPSNWIELGSRLSVWRPIATRPSVLTSKNRRILAKIWPESHSNSSVRRPYESEELGLARAATDIKVSTKEYYFLPNLYPYFRTFSTIQQISKLSSLFSLYKCQTWTRIHEIRPKSYHVFGVQRSIHLIELNWPIISRHSVFSWKNRCILIKIWLESRNNSSFGFFSWPKSFGLQHPQPISRFRR